MIVPILTLLFGSAGGYFFARARSLESEREAERQRLLLTQELAASRKALPPSAVVVEPEGIQGPSPLPSDSYRAPDKTAVIKLPVDAEDFDQLGDAICTCYLALRTEAAPGVGVGAPELRDCLLMAIYPDFQWPPVPGDPVEAQLMWMIADHESRKALAGSDLQNCALPPSMPPRSGPIGLKGAG